MNTDFIIYCLHQIIHFRLSVIVLLVNNLLFAQNSNLPSSIYLHQLYEPNPVPFHFETPGWYILFAILLIAIISVLVFQFMKFKKNRYRRNAIKEIENLETGNSFIPGIFAILKKTAIHAFGREKTGNLYGKEWIELLERSGKNINLSAYSEEISDILYKGKTVNSETELKILLNAKKWVKTHACKF